MKDTAFRIGIVGCGYGAQVLAPAFRSDPRLRLVAISARSEAKAGKCAQDLGIPQAFGNWRDMLDPGRIDAVAIATPPDTQTEIALEALGRGIAVFAEKPLALSVGAAQELVRAADASGLANMIDFNFREVAAFRAAREVLQSAALGAILSVAVTWHVESYANRSGSISWKTDEASGGGALMNFVSHCMDYLEWMLGPIASLCANLAGMPGDERKNNTFVGLNMKFECGVPAGLIMSAAAYGGSGHRIEIYGEEGSLVLENPGRDYMRGFRLLIAKRPEPLALADIPITGADEWSDGRVLPASRLAKRFTDWALGGASSEPSFHAGLRVQTLLAAAQHSNQTGTWVKPAANALG